MTFKRNLRWKLVNKGERFLLAAIIDFLCSFIQPI